MRPHLLPSLAALMLALSPSSGPVLAESPEEEAAAYSGVLQAFVEGLWPEAEARGVRRTTFEAAASALAPDPEVIARADNQPEHERAVWEYLDMFLSDERLLLGREKLAEQAGLLAAVEVAYGVDRHVVLAIWGVESLYGRKVGDYGAVRSLATLAWQGGRRAAFGRRELLAALSILERGDVRPEHMTGSWAGAMGHTQFIPTTYTAHAVDFDKDGRRDIWGSVSDALASTANYLRVSGWRSGEPWGFEVVLPAGLDWSHLEDGDKPLAEWARLGLTRAGGQALASGGVSAGVKASLILPAGHTGPAFLVTDNFQAILRYNNAVPYALAVSHLADRLEGKPQTDARWPLDNRPLGRTDRGELQRLLTVRGFEAGEIDGIVGGRTRGALRAWQRARGLVPDGYPSQRALERLRADSGLR